MAISGKVAVTSVSGECGGHNVLPNHKEWELIGDWEKLDHEEEIPQSFYTPVFYKLVEGKWAQIEKEVALEIVPGFQEILDWNEWEDGLLRVEKLIQDGVFTREVDWKGNSDG